MRDYKRAVVGHEREEVRGDETGEVDGQDQGERPGTATTTGRHRVDISSFKPWLYHVQSHGDYST